MSAFMVIPRIISTIRITNDESMYKTRIEELIRLGVNILRFNVTRYSPDKYIKDISLIKKIICDMNLNYKIGILLDLPIPGSKIRIGLFPEPEIEVKKGQKLVFKSGEYAESGLEYIPIKHDRIGSQVYLGQTILIGDGEIKLEVDEIIDEHSFSAISLNSNYIRLGRSVALGKTIDVIENATEIKANFDIVGNVCPDYIAFSFIEGTEQIKILKRHIGEYTNGSLPKFVSKIESLKGILNLEDITKESDGLLIGRGDLALAAPFENLGIYQKRIIKMAKKYNKEAFVATDILDSLYNKAIPSRSEIVDITQMILDGADGIILSAGICAHENFQLAMDILNKVILSTIMYGQELC